MSTELFVTVFKNLIYLFLIVVVIKAIWEKLTNKQSSIQITARALYDVSGNIGGTIISLNEY